VSVVFVAITVVFFVVYNVVYFFLSTHELSIKGITVLVRRVGFEPTTTRLIALEVTKLIAVCTEIKPVIRALPLSYLLKMYRKMSE
jgi:hypothetical protein